MASWARISTARTSSSPTSATACSQSATRVGMSARPVSDMTCSSVPRSTPAGVRHESVVDGVRAFEVAREPVHARRVYAAPGAVAISCLRRARHRELRELGRVHGATACGGMGCCGFELSSDLCVGLRHCRREVPRALLRVAHDVREPTVRRAAAGRATALVAERCEQRA